MKLDAAITSVCDHQLGRDIMELTADELHAKGYELVAEAIERPAQLAAVIHCHIGWAQGAPFRISSKTRSSPMTMDPLVQ